MYNLNLKLERNIPHTSNNFHAFTSKNRFDSQLFVLIRDFLNRIQYRVLKLNQETRKNLFIDWIPELYLRNITP